MNVEGRYNFAQPAPSGQARPWALTPLFFAGGWKLPALQPLEMANPGGSRVAIFAMCFVQLCRVGVSFHPFSAA
tara:strand:- start:8891 stop:9112 length:222 start_codon:yes stop_codon:yes gene_type:complete